MGKPTDNLRVVAFEGGNLRELTGGGDGHEAVLALPLSRLIVRMAKVPADADATETVAPLLQAMSPFPDEELTIGLETVREGEDGKVVIAAALPESAADDIGEALDAKKLSVVRIDSLALGQLRGSWSALGETTGRRIVLIPSKDCISLIALDGDQPSAIRAITDTAELKREVMLSLLEAEDFGGARKLTEIIVIRSAAAEAEGAAETTSDEPGEGDAAPDSALPTATAEPSYESLSAFAPVRTIEVGEDAALVGVAERNGDEGALNALPASWHEMLVETRFKRKLTKYLAVAGGIWALIIAVLFGVPIVYGFMTDYQKSLSKQHARQYAAVKEMKAKVDLVRKYSDHARGALEIMKAVSDRLPEGIILSSWNYKREDGVRVVGDAETAEATYAFKDAMDEMAEGEEGDGEKIFGTVNLNGPNAAKGGYRFDLDCQYHKEDEE